MIKLMVAVGVGRLIDLQRSRWDEPWTWQGQTRPVWAWADGMVTESRNEHTSALVALLHARGLADEPDPMAATANGQAASEQRTVDHGGLLQGGLNALFASTDCPP